MLARSLALVRLLFLAAFIAVNDALRARPMPRAPALKIFKDLVAPVVGTVFGIDALKALPGSAANPYPSAPVPIVAPPQSFPQPVPYMPNGALNFGGHAAAPTQPTVVVVSPGASSPAPSGGGSSPDTLVLVGLAALAFLVLRS